MDEDEDRDRHPLRADPTYRLRAEELAALPSWVSVPATERLLSGMSQVMRRGFLELLKSSGDGRNENVPQIRETGEPGWDRAIWDLYELLRGAGGVGEDFPFAKPHVADGRNGG